MFSAQYLKNLAIKEAAKGSSFSPSKKTGLGGGILSKISFFKKEEEPKNKAESVFSSIKRLAKKGIALQESNVPTMVSLTNNEPLPSIETKSTGAVKGNVVKTSSTPTESEEKASKESNALASIDDPFTDTQRIVFAVATVVLVISAYMYFKKRKG